MKITACDLDRQTPAKTYTITPEGEEPVDLDLCEADAAPIEELIRKVRGGQVAAPKAARKAPAPTAERVTRSAPAKKTPEKKTPAGKTTAGKTTAAKTAKGPKIMTMAEIEAQKQERKQNG
ncbi:hypothetical protein KME66_14530 [Streptomyces sp. YPW6]|uniref:hypothetical protein n=1 Tax=Streptomyces sp. YPW6 TaxID=2840373 RepID=UPI001C0AEEE6|nr:hypothetical protein [Streptomyces sp. YPW6]QWQ42087.1 hypothetical protein KME66_14530 [Streptomyces sp. YPW6]